MEAELDELIARARAAPDVVGAVLFGSAASGSADGESDVDVFLVFHAEPLPPRERRSRLEIVPTTIALMRAAPHWLKPALAYGQVLLDETGELEAVLREAREVSRTETAELYDAYLNDVYRSLKAWRRGNELAGRIECGRSMRFLGELLFALDGVRAPYPKEWPGKLGEFEPLVLEVTRTADPRQQQALCARVREHAAERGYSDVYDAWNGDIDRALAFDFV